MKPCLPFLGRGPSCARSIRSIRPVERTRRAACLQGASWVLGWLLMASAAAFPPAPNHTFYGVVRDQMGDPLVITNAVVVLETSTGIRLKTSVVPNRTPGVNYRLAVPMDSGLTADNYKPTALRPMVSFRIKVQIGSTTYLPIELRGDYASLGQPAQRTRLDLTLGEDADGDGLPDAWEWALVAMMGGGLTPAEVRPEDDADGDGLSNLQEYTAGTYAFDPADGFRLEIAGSETGPPRLDFLAIRGRTYALFGSTDAESWTALMFRRVSAGPLAPWLSEYAATSVQPLQIEAQIPDGQEMLFFRLQVR